jgi:hypothetical protein
MAATTPAPLPGDLEHGLRRLKLAAMRQIAPELLVTAKTQRWAPEELLRALVEVEITARDASNTRLRSWGESQWVSVLTASTAGPVGTRSVPMEPDGCARRQRVQTGPDGADEFDSRHLSAPDLRDRSRVLTPPLTPVDVIARLRQPVDGCAGGPFGDCRDDRRGDGEAGIATRRRAIAP